MPSNSLTLRIEPASRITPSVPKGPLEADAQRGLENEARQLSAAAGAWPRTGGVDPRNWRPPVEGIFLGGGFVHFWVCGESNHFWRG